MTIFNTSQTFTLSDVQNNIFVDGEPECDICVQKGIKYGITANLTKQGLDKTSLWATFDKDNNILEFEKNGSGRYPLFKTTKRVLDENTIYLNYSPDFLYNDSVTDTDKAAVIRAFRSFSFLIGQKITGVMSSAIAHISAIDTFCDDFGNVVLGLTSSTTEGVFEAGEPVSVSPIASDEILRLWRSRSIFYDHVPDAANQVEINHVNPFVVSEDFGPEDCAEVKDISTFLENTLSYDSFSTEKVTEQGCSQTVQNTMTLQYTPDLLKIFCDQIICDWDEVDLDMLNSFPLEDFLTGQTIFGRHSKARAIVESISIIRQNGCRFINVCLNGATSDFQANEPIEILDLGDSVVARAWSFNTEWAGIPNYFETLQNYYVTPFFTASDFDNAFHSGQIAEIAKNILETVGISIDGCVIDPSLYDVEISRASDLYFECAIDRCSFVPENELLYTVKLFDKTFDIGSTVRIRKNVVPFVERTEDGMCIEVPADTTQCEFYYNIDDGSVEPLKANIKEFSQSSLHYSLDDLISEDFACEYPEFFKFFEYYFAFTNSFGQGKYAINNASSYNNLDTALDVFLPEHANETIPCFVCNEDLVNSRNFQRHIHNFYDAAGTDAACEYFFQTVYGVDCEVKVPCDNTFVADSNKLMGCEYLHTLGFDNSLCLLDSMVLCTVDNVLLSDLSFDNSVIDLQETFVNQEIRGVQSRAHAIIDDIEVYYKDGCPTYKIKIVKRFGQFIANEPLEISDFDLALATWIENDPRLEIVPNFRELYENIDAFLINIGNILQEIIVDEVEFGDRWNYRETLDVAGYDLCGLTRVDCIDPDTCMPLTLIADHYEGASTGIPNGETVTVERKNSLGEVVGRLTGTAVTGSTEITNPIYTTRESFANDHSILDNNCETMTGFYYLCVPLSRNEYIDNYDKLLREAGTLAYSDYPVKINIAENPSKNKVVTTVCIE